MSLRDLRTAVSGIHYLIEQSSTLDDLDALSKRLINIDSILLVRNDSPEGNALRDYIANILDECIVKMVSCTKTDSIENIYAGDGDNEEDEPNELNIYMSGLFLFLSIILMYTHVWNATFRMLRPRQI